MDCNIVKDLIPLYIDECCSKESAETVKEHIDRCTKCRELYENMNTDPEISSAITPPVGLKRINNWCASILQSILLFVSFAIITVGVALEASTSTGLMNSYWAISLVIPATGFMLSLANWYFVRLYKSRKSFSNCSLFATLGITLCAYIWAGVHYEFNLGLIEIVQGLTLVFGNGILLTAVFCVLSKVLSNKYAKMLGKE